MWCCAVDADKPPTTAKPLKSKESVQEPKAEATEKPGNEAKVSNPGFESDKADKATPPVTCSNSMTSTRPVEVLATPVPAAEEGGERPLGPELEGWAKRFPVVKEIANELDEWERKKVTETEKPEPASPPRIDQVLGGELSQPGTSASMEVSRNAASLSAPPPARESPKTGLLQKKKPTKEKKDEMSPPGSPSSVMSRSTKAFIRETARRMSQVVGAPKGLEDLFTRVLGDPSKESTSPWTNRVRAMKAIKEICLDKSVTPEEFKTLFESLTGAILLQLTDRRSQVCKLGCVEMEAIVRARPTEFLQFAPAILLPLCKLTKVTVKIISVSAMRLSGVIVKNINDEEKMEILDTIHTACRDRARYVRRESYKLLQDKINSFYWKGTFESKNGNLILSKTLKTCKEGVDDSDAKTRSEATRALVCLIKAISRKEIPSESKSEPRRGSSASKISSLVPANGSVETLNQNLLECGEAGKAVREVVVGMSSALQKKLMDTLLGLATPSPAASPTRAKASSSPGRRGRLAKKTPKKKGGRSKMRDFIKQQKLLKAKQAKEEAAKTGNELIVVSAPPKDSSNHGEKN
uniref:TOG domain-containing protein n=1 Tax=Amorphochlora amoebiformis TaxID=1561963 RepID=A0A7S0DMU5_9EUKA|mmetsp:Transcript_32595/g.52506  ORF Transcript_32595/g.52506 Transcript_32595/m.52506 type:complete len:580 (+) Transcript_32595:97-1836(+)